MLANLPYVRDDEWDALQPEIASWEPREALVRGGDGLDAIRELVAEAPPAARGWRWSTPRRRPRRCAALLDEAETLRDLAGRERVTVGAAA